jgi:hypothetical protein
MPTVVAWLLLVPGGFGVVHSERGDGGIGSHLMVD